MKFNPLVLSVIFSACVLALTGCGSSSSGRTSSASFSGEYRYGTGPNKTKPMPQNSTVNIDGIGGAKPVYERQRTGGCNADYKVLGKSYMIWNGAHSYIEEGIASWYGPGFHGRKTSNGEIYNQKGFTAAHKNLPLPSYLKVTNLSNGKKVIVRVNDRGPFVSGRIIDLSEGSARALNMVGTGTAKVRIELIDIKANGTFANAVGNPSGANVIPKTTAATASAKNSSGKVNNTAVFKGLYIQIVACNSDTLAKRISDDVKQRTHYSVFISKEGNINRVLVGPIKNTEKQSVIETLKSKGYTDCFAKQF